MEIHSKDTKPPLHIYYKWTPVDYSCGCGCGSSSFVVSKKIIVDDELKYCGRLIPKMGTYLKYGKYYDAMSGRICMSGCSSDATHYDDFCVISDLNDHYASSRKPKAYYCKNWKKYCCEVTWQTLTYNSAYSQYLETHDADESDHDDEEESEYNDKEKSYYGDKGESEYNDKEESEHNNKEGSNHEDKEKVFYEIVD